MQRRYPDRTTYSPTGTDGRTTSSAFMFWHARLSRLNSASDVAGRDQVVVHPDRASTATTMQGQRVNMDGRSPEGRSKSAATGRDRAFSSACKSRLSSAFPKMVRSLYTIGPPRLLDAQDGLSETGRH